MRFIITAQAGENRASSAAAEGLNADLITAYMRFTEEMHKAGILVASEGLTPGAPGARIATANGKRFVVDGPFPESKELVGGFYVIDVDSLEEAISWALRAPTGLGTDDILDVRRLTGADDLPAEVLQIIEAAAPTWSKAVFTANRKV